MGVEVNLFLKQGQKVSDLTLHHEAPLLEWPRVWQALDNSSTPMMKQKAQAAIQLISETMVAKKEIVSAKVN